MSLPFSACRPHLQFVLDVPGDGAAAGLNGSSDPVRLAGRAGFSRLTGLTLAAARGGIDSIQIRGKNLPAGTLLEVTAAIIEAVRTERHQVLVLVNGRLDVALLAGADGVHLPEASFDPLRVPGCRRLALSTATGRPFLVGRSIHSHAAVTAPGTGRLDYLVFGHVFATPSKPGVPARGLAALARAASLAPVPVLGIGGITPANAAEVIQAGAAGVAVISAIRDASDPFEATLALRRSVDEARQARRERQGRQGGSREEEQ